MGRIKQLDGWRGVSILLVIFGHLMHFHFEVPGQIDKAITPLGVETFFTISGFIITKLALQELDRTGAFSLTRFYTARAFRILPPLAAYLLCVLILASLHIIDQPLAGIARAAMFVCNVRELSCGWFAGQTWTLSVEEQFYLAFPFLFLLAWRKATVTAICATLVLFPIVRFALRLGAPWSEAAAYMPAFAFIAFGSVCALYESTVRDLARGAFGNRITAAVGAMLLGVVALQCVPSEPGTGLAYVQAGGNTIIVFALGWLVASSVHQTNALTRALTFRPLLFFGTISYSLYLWQQLFSAEPQFYFAASQWFSWPLMLPAATAAYYLVERPAREIRRALARSTARASSVGSSPAG